MTIDKAINSIERANKDLYNQIQSSVKNTEMKIISKITQKTYSKILNQNDLIYVQVIGIDMIIQDVTNEMIFDVE